MKRNILLNPGPATISMRVKNAQLVPDICPRELEFGELMKEISQGLLGFVKNSCNAECVLFGGSGTLAVEATISSVVGSQDKIAIIVNGAYGERMAEIAQCHQLNFVCFHSDFLSPLCYQDLELFLQKEQVNYLAVVHSETTSGLLNDLSQISSIAKKMGIKIIADCMSSYACYEINLDEADYVIASSNKNIQGIAGVSFVIAKKENINSASHSRSLYLNLKAQSEYFNKTLQMRFTPPVQTLYALKEAILELQEEGLKNRFLRYQRSNLVLRDGLQKMGFEIFPKDSSSVIITSILLPKEIDFNHLHHFCRERGFTIYPGKVMDRNMFRISNIGVIDEWDIRLFLEVLESFLNQNKL